MNASIAVNTDINLSKKSEKSGLSKVVISGMLGNGLEWYDYALYAHMSFIISELFFPGNNETTKLIATFGVFAVGFLFRPLGAILFGYIGDKYGRRSSLVIAILMMAIPTGCIGLLPTYEQIGVAAPIMLTIIRIFQGLSLGGEFSGSMAYIVECAPARRRGIAGSASVVSLIMGFLLGSFVALLFVKGLTPEHFRSWGWRIPFIVGIVIGLVGLYMRSNCEESPAYEEAKKEGHLDATPLRTALKSNKKSMLQAFSLFITVTMPFYLTSVYFLSFMNKKLGLSVDDALTINTITMIVMLLTVIASSALSDKYGRKPILATAAILMMLFVAPLFFLMGIKTYGAILAAQVIFGLIVGTYMAPIPAVLVELFPTSIRYTGMALSYNLAAAMFGGTAPMVCEWLVGQTGSHFSIAVYVVICNIVSLTALYFYKDGYKDPLR
jgi:MHS family proline/betaine transporter-like MFS transporter